MLDSIIFSKTKGTLEISVSVYVFKENDVFIAYCPSLDISGYNTTEEEARHSSNAKRKDQRSTHCCVAHNCAMFSRSLNTG